MFTIEVPEVWSLEFEVPKVKEPALKGYDIFISNVSPKAHHNFRHSKL